MEKNEKSGKQFEEICRACPQLLAFNRQITGSKDIVTVMCRGKCPFSRKRKKVI